MAIEHTYQQKAHEIIHQSIKSAVFIDEKALPFYQNKTEPQVFEEGLSMDLLENFNSEGISLVVHKYKSKDEHDSKLSNFLLANRDLILLDWKLNNTSGEEISLKYLSDIVQRSNIHFCAIYTSEKGKDLDNVFENILSFFSGETQDYFSGIKEELELIDGIESVIDNLHYVNVHRDDKEIGKNLGNLMKSQGRIIKEIRKVVQSPDLKCDLIRASIAFLNTVKSEKPQPCPSSVTPDQRVLIIKNTIIVLLNKSENQPKTLIDNLSKYIIQQPSSFTQLLGLEAQTIFARNSSFIDSELISISKEAILKHREDYKKEDIEHFFPEFIKEILIEKTKLNLRNEELSLLDSDFLDNLTKEVETPPSQKDLISMNVFYNSTDLARDSKLNFGDVFKSIENDEYFICITALCDCLRPEKIKNNFFFAKGTSIKADDALKTGDTAFISYLPNKVVKWTDVNKSVDASLEKYSPVYIKPVHYKVIDTAFDDQQRLLLSSLDSNGVKVDLQVEYITTIKQNYTQRIANHAFSHPIRVGVDFVKSN